MKASFVILHYLTSADTIKCIYSILENVDYKMLDIVVVDNGSPDNSINEVKNIFMDNNNVHFIVSKENLGFANGNNIGYDFAKKRLNSDFIILINNDTIIEQKDFVLKIVSKYKDDQFHILGPDIISLHDYGHQNPLISISHTIADAKKRIYKMRLLSFINKMGIYDILINMRDVLTRYIRNSEINDYLPIGEKLNVPLHGSCLIFSPDFVKKYRGLYSKTYMYVEEDILFFISQKEKLKVIYYPDLKILHKEDSSTDAYLNKSRAKRDFIFKNSIDSLNELIKIIKDNSRYKKDLIDE